MAKKLIITGAAGHLARVIIGLLASSMYKIRGLVLPKEIGKRQDNAEYVVGDVTEPETLEPLFSGDGAGGEDTTVIHTAAMITIQDKVSPAVYDVNVNGTRNVISACLRHKVRRLVYVSSVHAIPEAESGSLIRETSRFDKDAVKGAYAKTKAEATKAVLDAGKEGLDVVVLHPSGIIGPYDRGRNHIVQLIELYLKNKLLAGVRGGGFDFVDVRDVASGVVSAMERGRKGECYILSNRYVSIPELLEMVRKFSGKRFKLPCVPVEIAKLMAPVFEWAGKISRTRPLFTRYSLETLTMNFRFCHDKATAELGYHPRNIEETVRDTVSWLNGSRAR